MTSSNSHRFICLLVLLALLIQPLSVAVAAPPRDIPDPFATGIHPVDPQHPGFLFRALIPVKTDRDLTRIQAAGALVLRTVGEGATRTAFVLADGDRLADLVRLGFRPQAADELRLLVTAQGREKAWLARSLTPLLQKADALAALREAADAEAKPDGATASSSPEGVQALSELRGALAAVTVEQQAGIADSVSVDDDADGLTNTQESWWCTDPLNPNSDGDANGYTDGQEVNALLDFTLSRTVRWGYGAPFGPPNAWPDFNNRDDNPNTPACNDGDKDTIPDFAEVYMVGTRVPEQSTDHDKFDDGQELFGVTFCPGDPPNPCWGTLPAGEYWNFIQDSMPHWVLPPGDSPLVAAFPVPEVAVTPGSWHVERVTTITTSEGQMTQTSNTYETSVTRGESSSIADTVNWNNWEEVSQAVETPLIASSQFGTQTLNAPAVVPLIFISLAAAGGTAAAIGAGAAVVSAASDVIQTAHTLTDHTGAEAVQQLTQMSKYTSQLAEGVRTTNERLVSVQTSMDEGFQGVQSSLNLGFQDVASSMNNGFAAVSGSLDGIHYAIDRQGQLLARGLYDISYQLSRPRYTETRTNGHSWGGSQTTTHEVYEEHTQAEGVGFTTGQNWSTAWAVDSSHAANLTFEFTVKNTGTEYARELSGIVVNVYIGDDTSPSISYPAWEKFPNGKLENLFPVGPNTPPGQFSQRTFTTNPIALSLEQMKRIDLGERLTVKVESYSFGADELFYTNAVTGGVTVFIEDGVEDGDETVDSYVIPTWGVESVQDVLTRYFRCPSGQTCTDADGNLNALWTPEYDGVNPPTWHEHYLSDIAWWNVYLTQADAGDTSLQDLPAQAGSGILFRFNRDSDRDGYNDRAEFRYYCALPTSDPDRAHCSDGHLRADIHPQPEVSAGYVTERSGNVVTVKLAVENTGTFDAYGIDAVMVSPDDTTTITNNTIGGNGRVRPGNHVAVGSLVKPPDLTNWGASTAKPYSGGQYGGDADKTYTFTVETPGVVGQGSTSVRWSNGTINQLLQLGASYHAPLPLDVESGLQVGFNTGTLAAGAKFTVEALTPRDTFTYHINSQPYTPPVIVVSYSDPQGSHRFVTPATLTSLESSLAPYAGQMLDGLRLGLVAAAPFDSAGTNTTHLVANNPYTTTVSSGRVHLNFVSDGKLVLEQTSTANFPTGPTVVSVNWSAAQFGPDYHLDGDNILIAFWTDSEDNIIDSAARPFNTFAADPKPELTMLQSDATWDFGTAQQGTLLRRSFTFGNTGAADLLTYVSAPAGISVPQAGSRTVGPADTATYTMTLNTASLPLGAYDGTITVRTSDPAKPTQTVHVTGTVTQGVADAPVGALQRPLDTPANVSGNLGEWKEYTHNLGPDPQTLHPVKVYSQDYSKLWGVGKYATAFGQGTASYDMFGDGRDGVMPGNGNLNDDHGVGIAIVNGGSAGAYSLSVTDAYAGWRINTGDVVLIHQAQGAGAGCWELNKAASDYSGGATIQVAKSLQCNYSTSGNNHAQIQRVPQYSDCPATGTLTPLLAWNGSVGGIFAVLCSGTATVSGTIHAQGNNGTRGGEGCSANAGGAQGYGFWGGMGVDPCPPPRQGWTGEGIYGPSVQQQSANGNGGGGGNSPNAPGGSPGGSGSHASAGSNGVGGNEGINGAGATLITGNETLTNMTFGGGGGGAAREGGNSIASGGAGGGVVLLFAKTVQTTGSISTNGGRGGPDQAASGKNYGGGGAGGSIYLKAQMATVGAGLVTAIGGSIDTSQGASGSGGIGRIRVEYCESISGTTNPMASTQKLNCFIVEQIESAPYDRGRLNLPEAGTHTYQVQYGRKLNYAGAGNQAPSLRVPAGQFNFITFQALVSDMPSNGNLTVDVGNDGVDLWTLPVANAGQYTSANLAPAFNTYWASHGAPTSGNIDVPVKVTLDRAGQVFLTNVQATLTGSKTRFLRLPVQPSGYSSVTANLTIGGGSGPLSLAADVGDDGSIDWTSNTTPAAYPVSLTTGNLATAINAYLSGKTGEPDVPIRFYLTPFVTAFDMTGFSATPTGQPDGQLVQADITFSAASPTEGDPVTVTALVHNPGSLPTGPLAVSFHATAGEWGEWYIGSAFVPDVPAGGTAQAQIAWHTLGFTGDTPVTVRVDPANRLPESNEGNNEATKNLTIKTRPDLRVKQIDLSNPEPMAGEAVTVTLALRNEGQTAAGASHLVLYDGNPDSGGVQLGEASAAVAAGAETVIDLPWTPTVAGPHKLFVRADLDRQVNESDEDNNDGWRDAYAGLASPLLIDSGNGDAYDPAYTPTLGFGYLNGVDMRCGSDVASTQRSSEPSDSLQYRFDNLLPGHYYHLDLTFAACDGLSREQEIKFDDNVIEAAVLMDGITAVQRSYRLDPALYADRTLVLTIREPGGNPALVAEVNLYDIDYRYSDSGHSSNNLDLLDPIYPAAPAGRPQRMYGWLDGQTSQPTDWGTLPYQTRRLDSYDSNPADDPDKELRYRFDGLRSTLHYQLHMSFWMKSGSTVMHNIGVDDIGTGVTVETVAGQPPSNIVVDVPPGAYTGDGSIVVKITRAESYVNGGAFVNEIALEELTQLPNTPVEQRITLATGGPNWISFNVKPPVRPATSCEGVARTSQSATLYGDAFLGAGVAPAGSLVEAYNPSGVKTGCFKIAADGVIGLFPIYGAEGSTPGMQPGDPIILKINGIAANPTPYPVIWQSGAVLEVDLNAPDVIPVETLLAPIMAQVTKLQCENGTYLPPPADPRFNTCATVEPGRMVMIWVNSAVHLKVVGELVAPDRPLSLHSGYNWLGYLPTCELTVASALPSVAGKYDIIRSESGGYRPPPADPIYNTFNSLAPGRGYMIHMTEAATLTYPAGLCGGAK